MKRFHLVSFLTGIASGALVLMIVSAGMHIFAPATVAATTTNGASGGFGGGAGNTQRFAQRLGISQDALQKELDSGKTMQQIAQEHGVTFGGGRSGSGTFPRRTGSGAVSSSR